MKTSNMPQNTSDEWAREWQQLTQRENPTRPALPSRHYAILGYGMLTALCIVISYSHIQMSLRKHKMALSFWLLVLSGCAFVANRLYQYWHQQRIECAGLGMDTCSALQHQMQLLQHHIQRLERCHYLPKLLWLAFFVVGVIWLWMTQQEPHWLLTSISLSVVTTFFYLLNRDYHNYTNDLRNQRAAIDFLLPSFVGAPQEAGVHPVAMGTM